MRKLLVLVAGALVLALDVHAATVVLKGGKRIEVASFTQSGNLVVLRYSDGRMVSYPFSAVDFGATAAANAKPASVPAPADSGPSSPFASAMAAEGSAALVVTDMDVSHVEAGDASKGEGAAVTPGGPRGRVVLLSYEKKPAGDSSWDITAKVANQGDAPVQAVTATIVASDDQGRSVGSVTATLSGGLDPGQEGTMAGRLRAGGPVVQVSFDLAWQSIVPIPPPPPAGAGEQPRPAATALPVAAPTPVPAMAPVNPMDASRLTTPPQPPRTGS